MTSIQGLNGINANLMSKQQGIAKLTGSESFTYALDAAKNLIESNIESEKIVSQKTVDFMTGKNDNVVDLMVAQEKSSILLQYTLQVRNGLMNAYKEIMNLPV